MTQKPQFCGQKFTRTRCAQVEIKIVNITYVEGKKSAPLKPEPGFQSGPGDSVDAD